MLKLSPTIRWHYTTGRRLAGILTDGFIRQAPAGVLPGEKAVVWFTESQRWEPTVNQGIIDAASGLRRAATIEEMIELGVGLFRIGAGPEVALFPFKQFGFRTGANHQAVKALRATAKRASSDVDLWYFCLEPVHVVGAQRAIQKWKGQEWVNEWFDRTDA